MKCDKNYFHVTAEHLTSRLEAWGGQAAKGSDLWDSESMILGHSRLTIAKEFGSGYNPNLLKRSQVKKWEKAKS